MNVVTERLAVIAAVTLPITALSSVLGTNLIVNEQTQWIPLAITLVADDGRVSCEWAVVSTINMAGAFVSNSWRIFNGAPDREVRTPAPTATTESMRPADWAVFAAQMGHDRALLATST